VGSDVPPMPVGRSEGRFARWRFRLACVAAGGAGFALPILAWYPIRSHFRDGWESIEVAFFVLLPAALPWWAYERLRAQRRRPVSALQTAWWIVAGLWLLGWLGHAIGMGRVGDFAALAGRSFAAVILDSPVNALALPVVLTYVAGGFSASALATMGLTIGLPLLGRHHRRLEERAARAVPTT
jgi:hypothetical protein